MKKYLIISQYYYPETFKITEICEELAKRNKVVVLTGLPNYPKGEYYDGYSGYKKTFTETINNVNVIRLPIRPRHTGAKNLFLNYLSYYKLAKKFLKNYKEKFDAIFVYEISPVLQISPAIYYGKKTKTKVYTYCQDVWPESLKVGGLKENSPIFWFFKKWSKKLYNKSDYILISSPMFRDYLVKTHNCDSKKIFFLPQHATDTLAKLDLSKIPSDTIDFLYTGNVGKAQNILFVIKCFEKLQNEKIFLHIVGDGSEYQNCLLYVQSHNIKNIKLYGRKPKNELEDYFKKIDICILALTGDSFVSNTIPAKLQDYMSSGKMIIGSVTGDAAKIINEAKCGFTCKPNDENELIKIIKLAISKKDLYLEYGENGKNYFIKNYTMQTFMNNLNKILEETK